MESVRTTGRLERVVLAIGLFLLAPLVAEFLLGNLPITALFALILLAPLYGGGALLIREVARRTGRGWPTMLVLALAYGVLEEGLVTMSLFNPNYAGQRLLDDGFVAVLGIGVPWTVFVLGLHTIWSISVPIAIVEVIAGERPPQPWLGNVGLTIVGLVFLLGVAGNALVSISTYQFVAAMPQLVGTLVVVIALVWSAFALTPRSDAASPRSDLEAPHALLVGGLALVASSAFKMLPRSWPAWLYVGLVLLLAIVSIGAVWRWSHQRGWGDAHELALAGGALTTYAWSAFPETPVLPATPSQDLIGNVVFACGAVLLIGVAAWQVHRREADAHTWPQSASGARAA